MKPLAPSPVKALSIRQPFAWRIMTGEKTIEYRSWKTDWRGTLLVHVSSKAKLSRAEALQWPEAHVYGVLLGSVVLHDITGAADDYSWHLRDPKPFARPIPMVGMLGLWEPHIVANCDHCSHEQEVTPLVPSHCCERCRRPFDVDW